MVFLIWIVMGVVIIIFILGLKYQSKYQSILTIISLYIIDSLRNLTTEQKELITEFARTESITNGKVDGIEQGQLEGGLHICSTVDHTPFMSGSRENAHRSNMPTKKEKGFLQKLKDVFWTDEKNGSTS